MNPNNNQDFTPNNQKFQNSVLNSETQLKPLLPYHQYINKNKLNSNSKLPDSKTNLPNSYNNLQYNSNNSYQNFKYSPLYQSYYQGSYYNYPSYNCTSLPTYEQFKKQNDTPLFGYKQQLENIQSIHTNTKYSKERDSSLIQYNSKTSQNTSHKNNDINKRNEKNISNQYNKIINSKQSKTNDLNTQKQHKSVQRNQLQFKKTERKHNEEQNILDFPMSQQQVSGSEFQQDEQVFYQKIYINERDTAKTKVIFKKKDPILDSPEEIRKWIQMRKKNYPRRLFLKEQNKQQNGLNDDQKKQMSKLQSKIRKKIQIINGDTRNLLKKLRNIDILRRIVSDPKVLQKNKKKQQKKKIELKKNIIKNRKIIKQNLNLQNQEQSQISIEPMEIPASKLDQPIEQLLGKTNSQLINQTNSASSHITHQILNLKNIQKQQSVTYKKNVLFQYVEGKTENHQIFNPQRQTQFKKDFQRSGQPMEIINHLQQKQKQDKEWLNTLFDYKSNSHNYKYKIQTLQVNFKLQQIFQQTSHLLQAIRYIVKQNFFQENN